MMPDRDKVLKGLERCSFPCRESCRECPYYPDGTSGCAQLAKDALALLKEQEEHEKKETCCKDCEYYGNCHS